MRSTLFLPALVAMIAATATANDTVVQAHLFDELTPNCRQCSAQGCASAGCASPGCAAPASAGCAGGCGQTADCGGCDCGSGCGGSCGCGGSGCGGGKCGSKCQAHWAATLSGNGKCNVCNMPQHHRYPAVDHGYYYFRPYNYRHIRDHQEAVLQWGGDPRNPYSNEIFKTIYGEGEPGEIQWQDAPIQMPSPVITPEPVEPAGEPPVPMPEVDASASARSINVLRMISSSR